MELSERIERAAKRPDWSNVLQETSFKVDERKYAAWGATLWLPRLPTKLAIVLTIGLGVLLFVFDHWFVATLASLSIVLLWLVKVWTHMPPPEAPFRDPGPLRFDETGLYWRDLKGPFQWSWSELSRFEVDQNGDRQEIAFNVPDDARFDRISRWVFRRPSKRIHASISDVYEFPLAEIADKLNEFRNRAVGVHRP